LIARLRAWEIYYPTPRKFLGFTLYEKTKIYHLQGGLGDEGYVGIKDLNLCKCKFQINQLDCDNSKVNFFWKTNDSSNIPIGALVIIETIWKYSHDMMVFVANMVVIHDYSVRIEDYIAWELFQTRFFYDTIGPHCDSNMPRKI